jgi:hypothetical protein
MRATGAAASASDSASSFVICNRTVVGVPSTVFFLRRLDGEVSTVGGDGTAIDSGAGGRSRRRSVVARCACAALGTGPCSVANDNFTATLMAVRGRRFGAPTTRRGKRATPLAAGVDHVQGSILTDRVVAVRRIRT